MRIVNRKAFLALPAGVLFSKYEPCVFGELTIKEASLTNDFVAQPIEDAIDCTGSDDFVAKLDEAHHHGTSIAMDFNCPGRDGMFDVRQLFAVWEKADVEALITRLQALSYFEKTGSES